MEGGRRVRGLAEGFETHYCLEGEKRGDNITGVGFQILQRTSILISLDGSN